MDGFRVVLNRVTAVAQKFASLQGTPSDLASTLQGGNAVATGDRSLDASIRETIGQYVAFLTQFGEGLGQEAEALNQAADNYQSTDEDVAARFDQIGNGSSPAQPSSDGVPMASLGIADKINVA